MIGAEMGSYQFHQYIMVTSRKRISVSHTLLIVCPYFRLQAVRYCLHVGQTYIKMIAENSWAVPFRPFPF